MLNFNNFIKSYGIIYCLTNNINGKKYFGQTTRENIEDYLEKVHNKIAMNGLGFYLHRAIRKYGWDNFNKEVICECGNALSLNLMEDLCIRVFDTINSSRGYNLKYGGSHGKHIQETLEKMSKASKERWEDPEMRKKMINRMKNIEKTNEWCERISETLKTLYQNPKNHPNYRHDLDYITKEYLYHHHHELRKTLNQIAKENDCCPKLIKNRMKENNIEYIKHSYNYYDIEKVIKIFDDLGLILLEKEYINSKTSMKYQCKKCSRVGKKNLSSALKGTKCSSCSKIKYNFTKEYLKNQYLNLKKSPYQIAKENNCSLPTIRNYLKKFNIPIRNLLEAIKLRQLKE